MVEHEILVRALDILYIIQPKGNIGKDITVEM